MFLTRVRVFKSVEARRGSGLNREEIHMDRKCVICGDVHPQCNRCGGATRCAHDELGVAFSLCDDCDEVDKREFYKGIPREEWPDGERVLSSSWVKKQ